MAPNSSCAMEGSQSVADPNSRKADQEERDYRERDPDERGVGAALNRLLAETPSVMPAAGATGLALVLVVAAMCYLAGLALGAALSVGHTASDWTKELSGAVTVEIKPDPAMSQDQQTEKALAILTATTGVTSARALEKSDIESLLEPWLGKGNVTADLPLPRLIDVRLDPQIQPDLDSLAERLATDIPGAMLDTHRQWQAELVRAARTAQWLAYAILAVVASTTIAIVTFATRAGLSANREVVEVLHMVGAKDRFIASEVQRHFFYLGLRGGMIGLALAVATFLGLGWAGDAVSMFFVPVSGLRFEYYPFLLLVPAAVSLVSLLTARWTVMRALARFF